MMNSLRNAFFSDREVLNLLRETPLVQDALQAKIASAADRETAERNHVLDDIEANARRIQQLEKDIAKQKPRHDAAQAAYRTEADKLGALEMERSQCMAEEGRLCTKLGEHGEGPLDRALTMLSEGTTLFTLQIRELENDIANVRPDPFGGGNFITKRAKKVAELSAIKRRLNRTESALKVARAWVGARIHPREQINRVDALMASLAE